MIKSATLVLLSAVFAASAGTSSEPTAPNPPEAEQEQAAPEPAAAGPAGQFRAVDVFVDPGGRPLAAYQFELTAQGDVPVKLVGVEGGEHAAFKEPPYYDTRANVRDRIIIAAFNTGRDLPRGSTRVARLMLHVDGPDQPEYQVKLHVAASADAREIPATVTATEARTTEERPTVQPE